MNNEEPKKNIEILCNERSGRIIKEVLLADMNDPFNRCTMNAISTSGANGLPVNVVIAGSKQEGRTSFVSNPLCCCITAELTDVNNKNFQNYTAELACIDAEGILIDREEYEGRKMFQMTIGSGTAMTFVSALTMALSSTFVKGCELSTEHYLIDPDAPLDTPVPHDEDPEDTQQDPETGEPIPFPVPRKSDVVTDEEHIPGISPDLTPTC
jgi:hypothetical protein